MIQVKVEDDHENPMSASAYVTVNVTDVIELPDGQIAYYPFSGNADDQSGNGHDGIIHGVQLTTDRNGNAQSAYYFNGNLSYIDLGNAVELKRYMSDYSVTGWINLSGYSSTYTSIIISNRNSNTDPGSGSFVGVGGLLSSRSKRVEYVQNVIVTQDQYTFDYMNSNTMLEFDTWYYFCITYEYHGNLSNLIRIYINGNLESQKLMGEILDPLDIHTYLGCEPALSPTEYSFNGKMDEIEFYDHALTESEVMILFDHRSTSD